MITICDLENLRQGYKDFCIDVKKTKNGMGLAYAILILLIKATDDHLQKNRKQYFDIDHKKLDLNKIYLTFSVEKEDLEKEILNYYKKKGKRIPELLFTRSFDESKRVLNKILRAMYPQFNPLKIRISEGCKNYFFEDAGLTETHAQSCRDSFPDRTKEEKKPTKVKKRKTDRKKNIHSKPKYCFYDLKAHLEGLRQYPNWGDLQDKKYYPRQEEILEEIKNGYWYMLIGKPGSGKTVIANAIGYEWYDDKQPVYYVNAEEGELREWQDGFKPYIDEESEEKVLLIIDDCHHDINKVNLFLKQLHETEKFSGKVLLVTRPYQKNIPESFDTISKLININILKKQDVETNLCVIEGIIKSFSDGNDYDDKDELRQMNNKTGGDLHVLRFYLETWRKKGFRGKLNDISEDEVLKEIYYNYVDYHPNLFDLRNCPPEKRKEVLLALCALSQYEIPIQENCVPVDDGKTPDKRVVANLLVTQGLVEKIKGVGSCNKNFYQVFHSTPAKYFVLATDKVNSADFEIRVKSADDFTKQIIKIYLSLAPENTIQVLIKLQEHNLYKAKDRIQFLKSINFKKLGELSTEHKEYGVSIKHILIFLLKTSLFLRGITTQETNEFIDSIGKRNIEKLAQRGRISLDLLVGLDLFINKRCDFSNSEIKSGIKIKDTDYLTSIIRYPLSEENCNGFVKQGLRVIKTNELLENFLLEDEVTLKDINILIKNLHLFDPEFFKSVVSPILESFSTDKWQSLIEKADLRNISTFMKYYSPRQRKIPFSFPSNVSLSFIKDENWFEKKKINLATWAHLLFNLHYLNKADEAILFSQYLQNNEDLFIKKMKEIEKLFGIEYICWSLLMTASINDPPPLFKNLEFQEIIKEKIVWNKKDVISSLGLIGTMAFSGIKIPGGIIDMVCADENKVGKAINELITEEHYYLFIRVIKGIFEKSGLIEKLEHKKIKKFAYEIENVVDITCLQECLEETQRLLK